MLPAFPSLHARVVAVAHKAGIAGAFTVLPFPAGLGRIDQNLRGYDECELKEWLNIARELLVPRFDIHPKALSSTLAVKLSDMSLLKNISEHAFLSGQDEQTLAIYLATASDILRKQVCPAPAQPSRTTSKSTPVCLLEQLWQPKRP